MKRFDVFVPLGPDHVAATIHLPDGEPRALVALFSGGGGAPRSFYNSMWARTARQLVAEGFATLQVDWRGLGDSTGDLHADLLDPPVPEALAALRLAMKATGVTAVGLGGICLGGNAALAIARDLPECQSVAVAKLTVPMEKRQPHEGTHGRPKKKSTIRRALGRGDSRAHRLARRMWWRLRPKARPVLEHLSAVARRAPLLLLDYEASRRLDGAVAWVQQHAGRDRIVLDDIPVVQTTPIPDRILYERFVRERLTRWFDTTLPGAPAADPLTSGSPLPAREPTA